MLFESLNADKVPEKSFVERVDEELEMSQKAWIENGVVFTNRSGLYAFKFYRDHGFLKQKKKPDDFKPKPFFINNLRKKHVIP